MTEKQIVQKLNSLRELQPDASWLKANRDSLFSQISNSGAKELSAWTSFVINFQSLAKTVSMPAMALGSFMLFILVSSIFSHQLLVNAKPGQSSLYIARVISERAKLNTILNTESREKMAAQFATMHARDIMTVLSDPTFTDAKEVAKLNESFKNEIKTAKQNIAKTNKTVVTSSSTNSIATASDEVFSANLLKDENGVSLDIVSSSSDQILEEVNTLFDNKDYDKASKVLELIK